MRTICAVLILASGLTGPALAAETPAGGAWLDCSVATIGAYRDRVTVSCAASNLQGGDAPREFAIEAMGPLTDPVLRLAMAAKSGARPLAILYVKDPAANPPGCAADRCRRIAAVELK
jgi:hypothetical protein